MCRRRQALGEAIISKTGAAPENSRSKQSLRLWLRLLSCESFIEQQVRTKLRKEFGSTLAQFDVLAELQFLDKPLSMTELSNRLMVSNGNVTGVVDRLVRDGLVARVASEKDRRVNFISLTTEGRKTFAEMAAAHENWIADIFAELSQQEISQFSTALKRINTTIKK